MRIKEVINDDKKYLIGIKETEYKIIIYFLKKRLIGYGKLFKYITCRPLLPIYENIVSDAIFEYETKLKDNKALDEYMSR